MFGFGILVDMDRRIGVWSDVGFACGEREVMGKVVVWAKLTKALSNLARIGGSCPFDQVKERPSRGISITCSWSKALLKRVIRELLMLSVFFSSRDRMRLKSPIRTQGPERLFAKSCSSSKKVSECR